MAGEEVKLDKYFYAVWRGKWLILLAIILASAITALVGLREPTLHTATAVLQVGRVWKEPLEDAYVTSEIANSDGFLHEVAGELGIGPEYLKRIVQAETVTAGPPRNVYPILVRITARAESAGESVRLARSVAEAVMARHNQKFGVAMESHLERQRLLEARREELIKEAKGPGAGPSAEALLRIEKELDDVRSANSSPTETLKTQLVSEVVPGAVLRPTVSRRAAAAALIAALLGVAAAAIIGHFSG